MIWPLLFILSGFFSTSATAQSAEEQIREYYANIEEGRHLTESVWALINYAEENEQFREEVRRTGMEYGQSWVRLLPDGSGGMYDAIHNISLHFEDPLLQLYLQLTLDDEQKREEYYTAFRERVPDMGPHNTILRNVSRRTPLGTELFTGQEWNFTHFLVFTFSRRIDFEEETLPEIYSEQLLHSRKKWLQGASEYNKTFYHSTLIRSLYLSSNNREIDALYNALIRLDPLPNTTFKRNLYWTIDYVSYQFGRIDRSLFIQRTYTIPLTEMLGDENSLNVILSNHGAYLYRLGKFEEAREALSATLSDTLHLDASTRTLLLNNLSLAHYKLGDTRNYLETQFRTLNFARERQNYSLQLNILRNLHIYHRKNQNWPLALEYIQEARNIAEQSDDKSELASVILSQAVFSQQHSGNLERADQYLDEAEAILASEDNYRLRVRLLFLRADLLNTSGRPERSREIYREITRIGLNNSDTRIYLEALVDLADVELAMGNHPSARQHIREFNVHDISIIDFYVLVKARTVEAELAVEKGEFSAAKKILKYVSAQVLERAAGTTDPEAGYWHVEEDYLELFRIYADLLIRQKELSEAVALLDQFKMINDASLFDNLLVRSASLSEEELAEEKRLTEQIDRLRKKMLATPEGEERFRLQNEISSLSARKSGFSSRSGDAPDPGQFKILPIQARLGHHQAILHITRILDTFYLIRIEPDDLSVKTVAVGPDEEKLFETAVTGLRSGETDLNLLHELYRYLDLSDIPSHVTSLIVVPDSYLYELPLDVLPVSRPDHPSSYGAAHYLIEDMEISYLNNLDEFLRRSPRPLHGLDYAGFGISEFATPDREEPLVPLPRAPYEVKQITEQLDRFRNTRSFVESEATPAAFMNSAANARILHLAAHSTISENDPLFSRLYLHPGSGNNSSQGEFPGQIFAYQLFDLHLRNELIMLNSCDSGSGRYFQGAGIMGISRALRYAGARSLVLNSWLVNDQYASDFAIEFYHHINNGETKSRSLREAKLHFLKKRNANPHYWGPYMLNGETDALVSKPGALPAYAFLLTFLVIGIWVTRRRISAAAA